MAISSKKGDFIVRFDGGREGDRYLVRVGRDNSASIDHRVERAGRFSLERADWLVRNLPFDLQPGWVARIEMSPAPVADREYTLNELAGGWRAHREGLKAFNDPAHCERHLGGKPEVVRERAEVLSKGIEAIVFREIMAAAKRRSEGETEGLAGVVKGVEVVVHFVEVKAHGGSPVVEAGRVAA